MGLEKTTIDDVIEMADRAQRSGAVGAVDYTPKMMYEARGGISAEFAKAIVYWVSAHMVKFWTNELMMPIVIDVPQDTPPDSLETAMQQLTDQGWSVRQANNGDKLIVEPTKQALSELHSMHVEDQKIDDLFDSLDQAASDATKAPEAEQAAMCACGAEAVTRRDTAQCKGEWLCDFCATLEDNQSAES